MSVDLSNINIAVLIPCYNEEATVATVINDFKNVLPNAEIYVYDNNSVDNTYKIAENTGVKVYKEYARGKGNVVRRMFADIDADVYLLVDGDLTYDVQASTLMVQKLVLENLDIVNGARVTQEKNAYRLGHKFGNLLISKIIQLFFGNNITDVLSGYKVFSNRFVKSFPAISDGFEVETELIIFALSSKMPIAEIKTKYKKRPDNSMSKLSTFKDGLKILLLIFTFIREVRPFLFYAVFSILLFVIVFVTTVYYSPISLAFLN